MWIYNPSQLYCSPLVLCKQCFILILPTVISHIFPTLKKKIKAPLNGLAKVSLILHPILGLKVTPMAEESIREWRSPSLTHLFLHRWSCSISLWQPEHPSWSAGWWGLQQWLPGPLEHQKLETQGKVFTSVTFQGCPDPPFVHSLDHCFYASSI